MLLALLVFLSACGSESNNQQNAAEALADDPAPTEARSTEPPQPTETAQPSATPTALPPTSTATPTAEPSPTATTAPTETPSPTAAPSQIRTYTIQEDGSEARFFIDEILFGNPQTVVGSTEQVSGQITLDLAGPQDVQVSPIQVNARDLTTDNDFRNRALRSQILDSGQDDYQFITFTPSAVNGLDDEPAEIGQTYEFEISGDLQIRDISQPVTFSMNVTVESENELIGTGETTVQRADFDLIIPSVPGVANVSEEVRLEIDFTAVAAE